MKKVQVKDEVQETIVKDVVKFSTVEDIEKALTDNPGLADEFRKDEKSFIEKYVKAPEKEEVVVGADADVEVEPELLDISIDPKLLGTYIKNRDPKEAILEALKGNVEKDRTIEKTKLKHGELENELAVVRAETESLKKKLSEFETKKPDVKEIDITDLKDIDLFAMEGQDKVKEAIKALKDSNASLRAELNKNIDDIKKEFVQAKTEKAELQKNKELENEYSEVDELKLTERPIKEIESDYLESMKTLHKAIGSKQPLYDSNGQFSSEVSNAFTLLRDGDADLKAKCSLPEDFDDLLKAYAVRDIRNAYINPKTGKPMPYKQALKLWESEHGGVEDKIELQTKREAAIEKRKSFAKETPTKGGPSKTDASTFPREQVFAALGKIPSERTKEETELVEYWLKVANFSDAEIKSISKKNQV